MDKIILASNNEHKIKQFKEFYKDNIILSLSDIGYEGDIEETGDTFLENALIKVKTISSYAKSKGYDYPVIADDSGLEVDALNGEPGVYSARYAGNHGNDKANRELLLNKLKYINNRNAHYTACVVQFFPDGTYIYAYGRTDGCIINDERGNLGFGYDPIFYSYDLHKTFGEATNFEKSFISHRAKAIKGIKAVLGTSETTKKTH